MKHNKLVRDKIPDIIRGNGDKPVTRKLDANSFKRELWRKLQEEIAEFLESQKVEELVDILEVVYTLASLEGICSSQLEEMRKQKRGENGGFDNQIFLVETNLAQDTQHVVA